MNRTNRSLELPSGSEMSLIELRPQNSAQLQLGNHTVQLKFLDERPYSDYLSFNRSSATAKLDQDNTVTTEAEYLSTVRHNDVTTNRLGEIAEETSSMNDSKSLVLYDENAIVRYPPLSMNALMEYRPQLIAPGTGSFKQGRVKLFENK